MAELARWQATIVDEAGDVQAAASVEVRLETGGAPLVSIFSDREGLTPLGNPMTADSEGFAAFHVPGGAYRITATKGAFSRVWRYVGIGLSQEQDAPPVGVSWRFDDATADADPGSGLFRLNNAAPASATEIYIDVEDADEIDQGAWLETLDDGGESSDRGTLILRSVDNSAVLVATVTGSITADGSPAGYYTIPITVLTVSEAATFIAGAVFGLMFGRAGVDGGGGSGDVTGPAGGVVDDEFVYFNSTTGKAIKGSSLVVADAAAVAAATANRVLVTARLSDAAAFVLLTNASPVAVDWTSAAANFALIATADRQIGNPSNGIVGQWRRILIQGNNATPREITFASNIYVVNAATIDDASSTQRYTVDLQCVAADDFLAYINEAGSP
jgi:hypothetical protein